MPTFPTDHGMVPKVLADGGVFQSRPAAALGHSFAAELQIAPETQLQVAVIDDVWVARLMVGAARACACARPDALAACNRALSGALVPPPCRRSHAQDQGAVFRLGKQKPSTAGQTKCFEPETDTPPPKGVFVDLVSIAKAVDASTDTKLLKGKLYMSLATELLPKAWTSAIKHGEPVTEEALSKGSGDTGVTLAAQHTQRISPELRRLCFVMGMTSSQKQGRNNGFNGLCYRRASMT